VNKKIKILISIFIAILILVIIYVSINQIIISNLISGSDNIVTGEVKSLTSDWTVKPSRDNEEGEIHTDVKVSIKDSLKGNLKQNDEIIVRFKGTGLDPYGHVEELPISGGETVEGEPVFERRGEEVLLFLNKMEDYYVVRGGYRGKYTIENGKLPFKICNPLNKYLNTHYERNKDN